MNDLPQKFIDIKEKYGVYPKPMMVNLEVAKTIHFKTQTRRLDTKWVNSFLKKFLQKC